MRVLVTGARGQLGSAMVQTFSGRGEVVPLNRHELDITDGGAVRMIVQRERPDVIVNCAAFNDVDGAEDQASACLESNAFAVLSLARAAVATGATLVHYGTDFVFDGTASEPYTEVDPPNPQSVYAMSKLLGEWFAAEAIQHYVLRVESLFGGPQRRSSIDRIVASLLVGSPARVFVDRTVTPSYVFDVAEATWSLLSGRAPVGLYHCVNSGVTTWHRVGQRIKELLGSSGELVPIHVADVAMRAARPRYCALANSKLRAAGVVMPEWEDALERYLSSREAT